MLLRLSSLSFTKICEKKVSNAENLIKSTKSDLFFCRNNIKVSQSVGL